MSETPSYRRRRGREAYDRNTDPLTVCPYKRENKVRDFLDGWKEQEHKDKQYELCHGTDYGFFYWFRIVDNYTSQPFETEQGAQDAMKDGLIEWHE